MQKSHANHLATNYEEGSIASITSSAPVEVLVVRIKMEKKKLTQFFKQTSSAQYYASTEGLVDSK